MSSFMAFVINYDLLVGYCPEFHISGLLFVLMSILSKHVEHNKCPFFCQYDLVDLSISFLQIRHLKIGGILVFDNFLIIKKRLL